MVLGLRSKSKKGASFPIEFYIQVQEIKPWTKKENPKRKVPVVLRWQRGDKRSGNTRAILPEESPDGGRIVFHESFRLPATLYREESKSGKSAKFQKKCIVFTLYESSIKGEKLGTAVLDLADFGSTTALVSTNIPLALAKKTPSGVSSSLFLSIGPFGNKTNLSRTGSTGGHGNSAPGTSAPSKPAADPGSDSEAREALIAALMSDDNEEIADFTDDEEQSPRSSSTSSALRSSNARESASEEQLQTMSESAAAYAVKEGKNQATSSQSSPILSAVPTAATTPTPTGPVANRGLTSKEASSSQGSSLDMSCEPFTPDPEGVFTSTPAGSPSPSNMAKGPMGRNQLPASTLSSKPLAVSPVLPAAPPDGTAASVYDEKTAPATKVEQKPVETGNKRREDTRSLDGKSDMMVQDAQTSVSKGIAEKVTNGQAEEAKPGSSERSAELAVGRGKSAAVVDDKRADGRGEFRVLQEARARLAKGVDGDKITERFENKALDEAIRKLEIAEARIGALQADMSKISKHLSSCEAELTDIAAAEISLYSVVPEHGGSPHKVHSPARRLGRLYIHACKLWTPERRASSARNSVAAIVLVVKGCGHDVPRLTFWWSNVVVLRESLLQACSPATPNPTGGPGGPRTRQTRSNDFPDPAGNGLTGSPRQTSAKHDSIRLSLKGEPAANWKELVTYTTALERVEAWIHGRVIECVWWQAMAPPMQRSLELSPISSPRTNSPDSRLTNPKGSSELGDGRQGIISIEIWKKALLKVFKRVCPVRAAGHDCGCLQSLITLILEQCAARLDVAIFNALLRDASDFVATDPISDPIGDPSVLPVAPGRLTFGDGAQLKNAVGTWSTWLAGLLGTGDESASGEIYNHDNDVGSVDEVDKGRLYFILCRATADLLMLPKDILMDKSVRKEVCPALSLPLIRRILSIFEPDEFFPDPVSPSLLAALNAEVTVERRRHGETDAGPGSVAMALAPTASYVPPPPASVQEIIGESTESNRLNRSTSIMRKGYTSDDELEDLGSPASLLMDPAPGVPRSSEARSSLTRDMSIFGRLRRGSNRTEEESGIIKRFSLLKEVWASY